MIVDKVELMMNDGERINQAARMVAHEPHTDPHTMIEELQWELDSQRAAWLEIVAAKDAEITVLTLCRDGLEGQNDKLRAMVQCSDDALRAENVELRDTLKAINKELHELRIKAGLGQR